jgi:RsiW-degrading membrane proteinase PrsW (M82 family)
MRLKHIFKTGIFNVIFQFLFIAIMFVLGSESRLEFSQGPRFLILASMVLISGLIWIWFFYLQDRREPEPIPYIIGSFVAGMTAWTLLGNPLINIIFQTNEWIHASMLLFIQGSFLIKGMVFSLVLFGIIRFGIMPMKEFDEPVDGMVYGAITGAGYAVALTIQELWGHPDYTLFAMAYTITTGVMVFSAVGSLMGYYIGKAKFIKQNFQLHSVMGVTLGILLLGFYTIINEFLFISALPRVFWISFIFTMLYAILILIFCTSKMKRLTGTKPKKSRRQRFQFKPLMLVYSIGLFLTGSIIAINGCGGTQYFNSQYGISFNYPHSLSSPVFQGLPHGLIMTDSSTEILFNRKHNGPPDFQLTLKIRKDMGKLENHQLMSYISFSKIENMQVQNIEIGRRRGKRITCSYLMTTGQKSVEFPTLIKVVTDIIPIKNNHMVLTFSASSSEFEAGFRKYQKIISTLSWTGRQ